MRCRLILLLLLSACSSPISVQMEYLSRRNLASYHVGTPDPQINCPRVGERLIIQWCLPKKIYRRGDLTLLLTLRYHNLTEATAEIPIRKRSGTYIYDLTNDAYFAACGIQTYKIELFSGDCLLLDWKHALWAELIQFPDTPEEESEDPQPDSLQED